MSSPPSWGPASRPGGGPSGHSPAAASIEKSKEVIAGPGRCLFAVVVPPKDLEPEDVRANVKTALATLPPQYHVIEHEVGAIAFLGDGTPFANSGPAHAPQVLERPEAVVVLVSPQLNAADVCDAFVNVCETHSDPKKRAVALKMKLRELSVDARFSFVLLDLSTARVFCASTSLSSPLALGHASDGTLIVTCTRSGARAATAWPPRWTTVAAGRVSSSSSSYASSSSSAKERPRGGQGPKLTHQYGQSPGSSIGAAPLTPGRSISPATDRSRSRSPSACSTHSSSSVASDVLYHAGTTVTLNHLPAGRFVYGRRYLQPFEFSAFWNSAQTNRAGAPAASSPGDAGEESGGGMMGSPASPVVHRSPSDQSLPLSSMSPPPLHPWSSNRGSTRTTPPSDRLSDRRKYSSTGSRSDTSSSWRKKTVGGEETTTTTTAAEERAGNPTTSDAVGIPKSEPMAVPKMSGDVNNHTWPGGHRNKGRRGAQDKRDIDPETLMFPFGLPPAVEEERKRSGGESGSGGGGGGGGGAGMGDDRKIGKWVPRGRWTQRHQSSLQSGGGGGGGGGCGGGGKFRDDEDDALLRRSALTEGLPRRSGSHASELTRALSHPQVAI